MYQNLCFAVGVVITNNKKTLFYLQQKDEKYWIPVFRQSYCFFGGGIEPEEDEHQALKRELLEELEPTPAEIIYKYSKKLFDNYIQNVMKKNYKFSLYEAVLSNKKLIEISKFPVKEGRGVLIKRENILNIFFMTDLKSTLTKYLIKKH